MAESPLERLKRIAAEKKLAAASAGSALAELVTPNTEANLEMRIKLSADKIRQETKDAEPVEPGVVSSGIVISTVSSGPVASVNSGQVEVQATGSSNAGGGQPTNVDKFLDTVIAVPDPIPTAADVPTRTPSDHPLAMQFAELEAALLIRDPEFKVILRSIHRQLGTEPELVTMMTEEEIGLIVSGLVVFANAEIVEPAKAKTVKAAVAATKKKVISVDDL